MNENKPEIKNIATGKPFREELEILRNQLNDIYLKLDQVLISLESVSKQLSCLPLSLE